MEAKVLIVEDNDDCRALLRMLLNLLHCTVVEAINGLEGIERAVSTHPDLIIMDLMMPKMGGLEATKRLKESLITKDIPIVICTAMSREAMGYANLVNLPHDIVQKPLRLEQIRDLVLKYVPPQTILV